MRKTLLVITVLLVATQAYAGTVTMSVDDEGGLWAAIRYSSDANVSGFGLKVTADSGAIFTDINDYNVGECTASVQGYGIFPGTIDINDITGLVDNNGTPIAPSWDPCDHAGPTGLGTNTLILEMGALYEEGNEPALSGTLISVKVDGSCNVCVEGEPIRGNIVLTDANEAIAIYDCVFLQFDYDYGDADDSPYPTLLASNGARHSPIGPMLGANRDTEADGQPSLNCDLDDNTGVPDDEDGITNLVATLAGGSVTVTVTGGTCKLNAWIDFTNDGDWADAGEQIFTDQPLVAGPNTLAFAVPAGAVVETDLVSRWRVSTAGGDSYTGAAADGEVEDYNQPYIECHVPDVVGDPCDAAIAALIANGFVIGNITTEPNNFVALNAVISTDPPFCNYPGCATDVNMVVSEGPADPNIGTCWDIVNECGAQYAPNSVVAQATGLGGDSDCTGNVDFGDLTALKRAWGRTKGVDPEGCLVTDAGKYCCCTDFNHDGAIDFGDLTILKATWGNTGALPATGEQSCPP